MELSRILERIRKLFAVANDSAASENEVELAMGFARKLMMEHNLSESDVMPQRKTTDVIESDVITKAGLLRFERSLAWACCDICDVAWYRREHYVNGARRQTIIFYGLKTDVEVAKEFYAILRISVILAAKRRLGHEWSNSHLSYCHGFAARLANRASDAKRASSNSPGMAIVLCKDSLLKSYAQEKLKLRNARKTSGKVNSAWMAGWDDGADFDLGVDKRIA